MVRRWLMVLVAAGALLVLPAATAMAATGYGGLQVSTTNPVAGRPFQAVVDGTGCSVVRLAVRAPSGTVTIDGRRTAQTSRAGGGQVAFQVRIATPGAVRLSSTCKGGAGNDGYQANDGRGTVEVVVARKPVVAPVETVRPRAAALLPQQGLLPHVGSDGATTLLLGGGVVLLVAGGVLLANRRRGNG